MASEVKVTHIGGTCYRLTQGRTNVSLMVGGSAFRTNVTLKGLPLRALLVLAEAGLVSWDVVKAVGELEDRHKRRRRR